MSRGFSPDDLDRMGAELLAWVEAQGIQGEEAADQVAVLLASTGATVASERGGGGERVLRAVLRAEQAEQTGELRQLVAQREQPS
jgi:hypothetical protein